jgi:hypothetical protein
MRIMAKFVGCVKRDIFSQFAGKRKKAQSATKHITNLHTKDDL